MSYIYLSTNNINGKKYVGQHRYGGKGLDPSYHGSGHALKSAYKKYGRENFTMELLEECADEDLNEREVFYIKKYNTYRHGYNETEGGGGTYGYKHKETTKQKLRGQRRSEETRQKMSEKAKARKGRKQTKETRNKLSNIKKGCKPSEDTRKKLSISHINNPLKSKQINQYNDNGELIAQYPSIAEAARYFDCPRTSIRKVLNGGWQRYKGFRFRYANESGNKIETYIKPQHYKQKQVNQYSLDGEFIKTWNSVGDIERECGYNRKAIGRCCRGESKYSYGYMWRYADECCGTDNITPYQ